MIPMRTWPRNMFCTCIVPCLRAYEVIAIKRHKKDLPEKIDPHKGWKIGCQKLLISLSLFPFANFMVCASALVSTTFILWSRRMNSLDKLL